MIDRPIRRILIATDMSELAAGALRFGDAFREHLGASALVMFATEGPHTTDVALHDYVASHVPRPGTFNVRVVYGPADEAILATADEIGADLIIMGTHGRTGWPRVLLGSVAERVLHKSDRPVLSVNGSASGRDPAIRSILCPVNFTPLAQAALKRACGLARAFGARLTVMNVADRTEDVSSHVRRDCGRWIEETVAKECQYRQVFVSGDPAAVITQAGDEMKSDLVVIGARHRRFHDETVAGTTAEKIVRTARQPVLTVMWKPVFEAHSAA
jgi:nucleotide-binding universal stress UspA family protein